MLKDKSLRVQFVVTFVGIILMSLIATIITYYLGFNIYTKLEYKSIYPANYYEKKIPSIEENIRDKGSSILDINEKDWTDKAVSSKNITYQVVDENANIIYGTNNKKIFKTKEDLYKSINTTINYEKKYYVRVLPVLDENKICGAVLLSYTIEPSYRKLQDKFWILPLFTTILLSPFIYIIVFILLFSKKFTNNIGKPIHMIINASKKVKNKNLDFNIDYHAKNEIGELCEAFNDMKNELRNSLISKWKLEQERHEIVESLAHDLKTPFTIIQGCVEFLTEDNISDKSTINKYLNMIKQNTERGISLIKEMIYSSEIEDNSVNLNINNVNIEAFMMQKKENYSVISKDKNIHFDVNILDKRKYKRACSIDSVKLERILDNIVLNGIRYTPYNGNIKINLIVDDKNLFFTIRNSGRPFTSKELSNIFNKFYRGDESRSSKTGNAGLGLYIAKQLITIMGGTISACNEGNKGICIKFSIQNFASYQS